MRIELSIDEIKERSAAIELVGSYSENNVRGIATLKEAQKVLVEERAATLLTIASDVKIQIEFNPAEVLEYRLIGYENRMLAREDFNNDRVDAGDIGAGHTVTALYEVTLSDSASTRIDPLRYGSRSASGVDNGELAYLRLRYKQPGEKVSELIEQAVPRRSMVADWRETTDNFRFAAAVAAFGQKLRGAKHIGDFGYADIRALARDSRGDDRFGYRGEFLQLLGLANSLEQTHTMSTGSSASADQS